MNKFFCLFATRLGWLTWNNWGKWILEKNLSRIIEKQKSKKDQKTTTFWASSGEKVWQPWIQAIAGQDNNYKHAVWVNSAGCYWPSREYNPALANVVNNKLQVEGGRTVFEKVHKQPMDVNMHWSNGTFRGSKRVRARRRRGSCWSTTTAITP